MHTHIHTHRDSLSEAPAMYAKDHRVTTTQVASDGTVDRGCARCQRAHAKRTGLADGRQVSPRGHTLIRVQ